MKKAVIATGGKQYLVTEGDIIEIELVSNDKKTLSFEPLLTVDGNNTKVGKPAVEGVKVNAEVIQQEVKAEKVTAIRYKSKKRVRKVHGHRQLHTQIKITKIS